MKFVKPDHIDLSLKYKFNPLKIVEHAGRLCYQSEPKGDPEAFILDKIKSGHESVIEHAYFILEIPLEYVGQWYANYYKYFNYTRTNRRFIVSGNARAWRQFLMSIQEPYTRAPLLALRECCLTFFRDIPERAGEVYPVRIITTKELMESPDYTYQEIGNHVCWSVQFITDRGVTHEEVRHRNQISYSQESTRYCNYSKKKQGGQLSFIFPPWFKGGFSAKYDPIDEAEKLVLKFLVGAEKVYMKLVDEYKWKPQQARYILPNGLKTEIVTSTYLGQWKWVFRMRVINERAHPQIREVITPFFLEMRERFPRIFGDQKLPEEGGGIKA